MWLDPFRYRRDQPGINYGHYRVAPSSGLITATTGANSPLFSLLWNPAVNPVLGTFPQCLITRLYAVAQTITAFGAAQEFAVSAYVARAFTVADSGGTALTPFTTTAANYQKLRTTMGSSLMADMRIATTGPLTAGTRTLDGNPFASSGSYLTTTTAPLPLNFMADVAAGEHPLCLAPNEGIVIVNPIAFGSGGTVRLTVGLTWAEVPGF